MKKIFTLIAAASMVLAAGAESLMVYDGSGFDFYLPINSLFFDEPQLTTQLIFPAEDLAEMNGKTITSMTFFTDEFGCYMDGGQLAISLGETDSKEMTGFIAGLTRVATLSMNRSTGAPVQVVIEFDAPYEYKGGNLVFESYHEQSGSYGMTYFMGVRTDYSTGMAYSFGNDSYQRYFLPKTLFTYEDAEGQQTAAPNIAADIELGVHAYFVTITPNEESDLYYRYSKDNGEWTDWMPYDDVVAFEEDGYYQVEAYAIADGKSESETVGVTFIVTPRTGLDELNGDKTVSNVRYFNVAGQEMPQAQGLSIVVTTYSDGTSSTVKVMK